MPGTLSFLADWDGSLSRSQASQPHKGSLASPNTAGPSTSDRVNPTPAPTVIPSHFDDVIYDEEQRTVDFVDGMALLVEGSEELHVQLDAFSPHPDFSWIQREVHASDDALHFESESSPQQQERLWVHQINAQKSLHEADLIIDMPVSTGSRAGALDDARISGSNADDGIFESFISIPSIPGERSKSQLESPSITFKEAAMAQPSTSIQPNHVSSNSILASLARAPKLSVYTQISGSDDVHSADAGGEDDDEGDYIQYRPYPSNESLGPLSHLAGYGSGSDDLSSPIGPGSPLFPPSLEPDDIPRGSLPPRSMPSTSTLPQSKPLPLFLPSSSNTPFRSSSSGVETLSVFVKRQSQTAFFVDVPPLPSNKRKSDYKPILAYLNTSLTVQHILLGPRRTNRERRPKRLPMSDLEGDELVTLAMTDNAQDKSYSPPHSSSQRFPSAARSFRPPASVSASPPKRKPHLKRPADPTLPDPGGSSDTVPASKRLKIDATLKGHLSKTPVALPSTTPRAPHATYHDMKHLLRLHFYGIPRTSHAAYLVNTRFIPSPDEPDPSKLVMKNGRDGIGDLLKNIGEDGSGAEGDRSRSSRTWFKRAVRCPGDSVFPSLDAEIERERSEGDGDEDIWAGPPICTLGDAASEDEISDEIEFILPPLPVPNQQRSTKSVPSVSAPPPRNKAKNVPITKRPRTPPPIRSRATIVPGSPLGPVDTSFSITSQPRSSSSKTVTSKVPKVGSKSAKKDTTVSRPVASSSSQPSATPKRKVTAVDPLPQRNIISVTPSRLSTASVPPKSTSTAKISPWFVKARLPDGVRIGPPRGYRSSQPKSSKAMVTTARPANLKPKEKMVATTDEGEHGPVQAKLNLPSSAPPVDELPVSVEATPVPPPSPTRSAELLPIFSALEPGISAEHTSRRDVEMLPPMHPTSNPSVINDDEPLRPARMDEVDISQGESEPPAPSSITYHDLLKSTLLHSFEQASPQDPQTPMDSVPPAPAPSRLQADPPAEDELPASRNGQGESSNNPHLEIPQNCPVDILSYGSPTSSHSFPQAEFTDIHFDRLPHVVNGSSLEAAELIVDTVGSNADKEESCQLSPPDSTSHIQNHPNDASDFPQSPEASSPGIDPFAQSWGALDGVASEDQVPTSTQRDLPFLPPVPDGTVNPAVLGGRSIWPDSPPPTPGPSRSRSSSRESHLSSSPRLPLSTLPPPNSSACTSPPSSSSRNRSQGFAPPSEVLWSVRPKDAKGNPLPFPKFINNRLRPFLWPPGNSEDYCHQCRNQCGLLMTMCQCNKRYCVRCIMLRYDDQVFAFDASVKDQPCPACIGICNCTACCARRGDTYVSSRTYTVRIAGQSEVYSSSSSMKAPAKKKPPRPDPVTRRPSIPSVKARIPRPKPTIDTSWLPASLPAIQPSGPLTFWGTIYGVSGQKVATGFVGGLNGEALVVAQPLHPPPVAQGEDCVTTSIPPASSPKHRLFVGDIQPSWDLGPDPNVDDWEPDEAPPLKKSIRRRAGIRRMPYAKYYVGERSMLFGKILDAQTSSSPERKSDKDDFRDLSPLSPVPSDYEWVTWDDERRVAGVNKDVITTEDPDAICGRIGPPNDAVLSSRLASPTDPSDRSVSLAEPDVIRAIELALFSAATGQ